MPELLPPVVGELLLDASKFTSGLAIAKADMATFTAEGGSGFAGLASAAGAGMLAAGAAVAGFVVKGVQGFTDLATSIRGYQRATGESAQESSKAIAVAKEYGVSTDVLTRGMQLFGRTVDEHPAKLQKWGIEIARNADGTVNMQKTLDNVRASYQGHADATQKSAMAMDLFGRSGAQLAPVLAATDTQIKQITADAKARGDILSQGDINSALQYKQSIRDLENAVGGLARTIGKDFLPALTDTARGLAQIAQTADKALGAIGGLKTVGQVVFGGLASIIGHVVGAHKSAQQAADDQSKSLQGLTDQANQDAAAFDKAEKSLFAQVNAQHAYQDSIIAVQNAQHSYQDAVLRVTDAEDNLARAKRELSTLEQKAVVDAKAVETAQEQLAQADTRVADAHQHLIDVQTTLNDVMNDTGKFAKDQAGATLALEHQRLNQTAAALSVQNAERQVQQAYASGDPLQIATANLRLQEAQLGVRDAAQQLSDAQDRLNTINNQAIPGTREYNDLQRQLRDAQQGVTTAVNQQQDARAALATAERGDINRSQELADKRKAVRDAERGLEDAHWRVTEATRAVNDAQWKEVEASFHASDATDAFHTAMDNAGPSADTLTSKIANLGAAYGLTASQMQPLLSLLQQQASMPMSPTNPLFGQPGEPGFMGHASGGPALPGRSYLVGESGPEMFIPAMAGMVAPLARAGYGGGGNLSVSVTVNGMVTMEQLVRDIAEPLRREFLVRLRSMTSIGLS